ncbi:MAG: PEP-CTERM sorting domain-containing protein [Candidatus Accumulibacter sp.]|nr:PEP-CTERM sorting domain-containing protein [Accumulibacter sp.]
MSVVAQPPRPLSRQESLPEGEPGAPTAFGFDYADVDFGTPSTISFGAFSPELPQTGDADTGITPDDFAFFGVVASAGDIPSSRFLIVTSEGLAIDNVSFGTAAAVPEGGTLPLLSLGLVAAGLARRMRRS